MPVPQRNDKKMKNKVFVWAIVAEGESFQAVRIPARDIGSECVIALHPHKRSAEQAMARIRLMSNLALPPGDAANQAIIARSTAALLRELALPVVKDPY